MNSQIDVEFPRWSDALNQVIYSPLDVISLHLEAALEAKMQRTFDFVLQTVERPPTHDWKEEGF